MKTLCVWTLITTLAASVYAGLDAKQSLQVHPVVEFKMIESMTKADIDSGFLRLLECNRKFVGVHASATGDESAWRKWVLPVAVTIGAGAGVYLVFSIRGR